MAYLCVSTTSVHRKKSYETVQIDAVRTVRFHRWPCSRFIMQATISYSATDGGVRGHKENP